MDATYVSATSFTVTGDQTAHFTTGRKIKADCGVDGYKYGTVASSSYSTNTTVTIDESVLTSNLDSVQAGPSTIGTARNLVEHTHSTDPDMLRGMSLAYNNNSSVTINPGCIEIDGSIYYLSSSTTASLVDDMRSGESESASTYYYLYAIAGSSLTFGFSATAPTEDRFGNSVSGIDDTDTSQGWYHPTEGSDWRWIGQVYNKSNSNISHFTKCTPSVWIGWWVSIGTSTTSLSHGMSALPKNLSAFFSSNSNGSSPVHRLDWCWSGSDQYGCRLGHNGVITSTSIPVLMGNNGIFHNGSWRTSGYIQLVLGR